MALWTHVNGHIRIDNLFPIQNKEKLKNILLKSLKSDDYGFYISIDGENSGSDYCLECFIKELANNSAIEGFNISIKGDIRHFGENADDYKKMLEWFTNVCKNKGVNIRNAILEVDIECGKHYVFVYMYDYDIDKSIVKCIEVN